jgi:hypothetical protein
MASYGRGLSSEVALELSRIFGKATRRQMKLAGGPFQKIANAYKYNAIDPAARSQLNARIAFTMRTAVLSAYKTNVIDVRSAPEYRQNDEHRQSGNLLRFLEADDSFIFGDSEDIIFNFAPMTAAASHWGRLNFGAEPGVGHSGIHFPAISVRIQFGKNQGVSYEIPGIEGSGFTLPNAPAFSGHFEESGKFFIGRPGTGDSKAPKGTKLFRRAPTTGIGARHFVDAGLLALKENFKPFYSQYFEDVVRRTKAQEL